MSNHNFGPRLSESCGNDFLQTHLNEITGHYQGKISTVELSQNKV